MVLLAVLLLAFRKLLDGNIVAALVGGGGLIAVTGLLDDRISLRPRTRVAAHFVAAAWTLYCLGGLPALQLGWTSWEWGWIGHALLLVGMVWLVNLYNFMDGIDGIAGVEAVCAAGFGAGLLLAHGLAGLAAVSALLAASCAGFLYWNWPPAKIFMGDVGSGFLGFAFGLLAVASAREEASLLWSWLILLLIFIVDATVTVLRRFFGGEPWYQAHCSHAYQHASRQWGHRKVSGWVAALNILWLFPWAWSAAAWPRLALVFTIIAACPLVCLALYLRAGNALGRLQHLEAGVTGATNG